MSVYRVPHCFLVAFCREMSLLHAPCLFLCYHVPPVLCFLVTFYREMPVHSVLRFVLLHCSLHRNVRVSSAAFCAVPFYSTKKCPCISFSVLFFLTALYTEMSAYPVPHFVPSRCILVHREMYMCFVLFLLSAVYTENARAYPASHVIPSRCILHSNVCLLDPVCFFSLHSTEKCLPSWPTLFLLCAF